VVVDANGNTVGSYDIAGNSVVFSRNGFVLRAALDPTSGFSQAVLSGGQKLIVYSDANCLSDAHLSLDGGYQSKNPFGLGATADPNGIFYYRDIVFDGINGYYIGTTYSGDIVYSSYRDISAGVVGACVTTSPTVPPVPQLPLNTIDLSSFLPPFTVKVN
jgi:hypothetical protein